MAGKCYVVETEERLRLQVHGFAVGPPSTVTDRLEVVPLSFGSAMRRKPFTPRSVSVSDRKAMDLGRSSKTKVPVNTRPNATEAETNNSMTTLAPTRRITTLVYLSP